MGKRGPKPTPTAVLKLRGSTLVSRRREASEVRGPDGIPDCPDWLDDEAKLAWDEVVPMLDGMGVLKRIDGKALARYCRTWSRWRKAEQFIESKGEVYPLRDDSGKVKCFMPWPQVAIANKLAQQLTKLETEFGMTPSARARIQIPVSDVGTMNSAKSRFFEAG
ncbi:MAG: phage terminase small subunit P27 family [Phycisphaerales bacterium]|nr:phage terminase small subunit P27 family [Phycisphaerales bacterium]